MEVSTEPDALCVLIKDFSYTYKLLTACGDELSFIFSTMKNFFHAFVDSFSFFLIVILIYKAET